MIAVYMYMFSIVIENRMTIRGMKQYFTYEDAENAMVSLIVHLIDELGLFVFGYVHMA